MKQSRRIGSRFFMLLVFLFLYLPIFVLIVFSFFYSKGVQKLVLTVDESEGAMTTALQENLTGMRVVRTFARQSEELEKFTTLNKEIGRAHV